MLARRRNGTRTKWHFGTKTGAQELSLSLPSFRLISVPKKGTESPLLERVATLMAFPCVVYIPVIFICGPKCRRAAGRRGRNTYRSARDPTPHITSLLQPIQLSPVGPQVLFIVCQKGGDCEGYTFLRHNNKLFFILTKTNLKISTIKRMRDE